MNFITTDRPAFYQQVIARLAVYGKARVAAADGDTCARDNSNDLSMGLRELQQVESPAAGSNAERRAALLIGYLVARHALGALPVPIAPLPSVTIGAGAVVTHSGLAGVQVVGRVSEGSSLVGMWHMSNAAKAWLQNAMDPYIQPSAGLGLSPSGLQELGTTVTVTLDGSVSNGSDGAPTTATYSGGGMTPVTQTSSIGAPITVAGIAATATFSFAATFPTSGVKTGGATIPFAAPVFYGAGAPGQSANGSFITGLTKAPLASPLPASRDLLFTQAVGQTRYYAQVASAGTLSSILNNLNYEVLGTYTRTQQVLTVGSASLLYDVYEYQLVATQAATGLRNTFVQ